MDYQELIERLESRTELGLTLNKEAADAIESMLAENERLEHNLTSTEQTMREYQELAAKRLEETTKLKLDLLTSYGEVEELSGKVAELEKALKVARDGIDEFLVANDPTEFGCACDLSVGYLCGPCHVDKQQHPLKCALAKINEVLKP